MAGDGRASEPFPGKLHADLGTFCHLLDLVEMDDPLFQRADRAIRDSKYLVGRAREHCLQAKIVSARARHTVAWARRSDVNRRQLGLEMADMAAGAAPRYPADT